MATPAEIEQRIATLRATLGQLEAAQGAASREIGVLNAEAAELTAAAQKQYQGGDQAGSRILRDQAALVEAKVDALYASPAFTNLAAANRQIQTLESDLYAAQQKAEFDAKQASGPTATAEVKDSAAGATQNPPTPPASTGRLTTTEAATLAQNTETGTNPPVKTLTQTQSVPPANTGNEIEGRPGGEPGVGATSEDGSTAANTRQIISAVQANQSTFAPRNNVLDQYASYTYNIGWYLMTPEQYTALQKTSKISVSQYNLLVQSGGAPSSVEGVQPDLTSGGAVTGVSQSAGRNPFFGLDYYFDNLEIKSKITGKGNNRAHNATDIKFTVTETAGITLINNLSKAVKAVYKDSGIEYISAFFALVIRFYGYDENGKIVQASDSDNKSAVVEKIIPFKLSNIQFTVANKLVEYQVTAVPPSYTIGFGSSLGVIKAQVQISGATVKDILTKGAATPAISPADGRIPTPTPANSSTPAASTTTPQTLVLTGSANEEVGAGTINSLGAGA